VRIEVRAQAFDPWVEIGRYQTGVLSQQSRYGATAVFVGTMRDVNEAAAVHAMTLEHYPGMTERHLQRIAEEAMGRWDIIDILILHRIG
jgi:molybdopterin synthase catalytic subunit